MFENLRFRADLLAVAIWRCCASAQSRRRRGCEDRKRGPPLAPVKHFQTRSNILLPLLPSTFYVLPAPPSRAAPLPALVDILHLRHGDPAFRPALRFDNLLPLLITQFRVARFLAHGPAQERQFFGVGLLAPQRAVGVLPHAPVAEVGDEAVLDRKSTRLNSSHTSISY